MHPIFASPKKRLLFAAGFILCSAIVSYPYTSKWFISGRQFCLESIVNHIPNEERWDTPPPSEEALAALKQHYTYLAKGTQSTVFESEDNRYVIKFIRSKRILSDSWHNTLFRGIKFLTPVGIYKAKEFEKWYISILESYSLAFREMLNESKILYVHLNNTGADLPRDFRVKDVKGHEHVIDLNTVALVVQRKFVMPEDYLDACIKSGDLEKARRGLLAIKDLLIRRAAKNLTEGTELFSLNFGFFGDEAVQLDPGAVRYDPNLPPQEIPRVLAKLIDWARESYPDLLTPEFTSQLTAESKETRGG